MKTSNDFSEALMLFYESCHGGDRPGADAAIKNILRAIGGQATPDWTTNETAAAIQLSGGPRRPPTAGELASVMSGNRAMAQEADRELVF
jgi:hypothetical protein